MADNNDEKDKEFKKEEQSDDEIRNDVKRGISLLCQKIFSKDIEKDHKD